MYIGLLSTSSHLIVVVITPALTSERDSTGGIAPVLGLRALFRGGTVAIRSVVSGRLFGVVGMTVAAMLAASLGMIPPPAAATTTEEQPVTRPDSGSAMETARALDVSALIHHR